MRANSNSILYSLFQFLYELAINLKGDNMANMRKTRKPSSTKYALSVENLSVSVGQKQILKNVNIYIKPAEKHVIFGPNSSGKSTLALTIMGMPKYNVTSGKIVFNGIDITSLSITERSKLGIFLAFQTPPEIRGVKLNSILELYKKEESEIDEILRRASLDTSLKYRELNVGFSGGEKKKSEIAQAMAIKPKLLILDEIDSGIDVESLKFIGKELNEFISQNKCSTLIITHYGHILEYLKPDIAHVMIRGRIACSGKPAKIWSQIAEHGYGWCEKCVKK